MNDFKNSILKTLDAQTLARLRLKRVAFAVRHEIEFPGVPIDHLHFLEEGMASMTTTFQDGSQVEVGMFGKEAVIGVSALMGTKKTSCECYLVIKDHLESYPRSKIKTSDN